MEEDEATPLNEVHIIINDNGSDIKDAYNRNFEVTLKSYDPIDALIIRAKHLIDEHKIKK